MASVLLTYDVSQRHSEVKAALKDKGFADGWSENNINYYLPNTTMWKKGDSITAKSVKEELDLVVAELNRGVSVDSTILFRHSMAVEISVWYGIQGVPHKS